MAGRELPAILTPATAEQVQDAFIMAWQGQLGHLPEDKQVRVLMAQTALETQRWQKMIAFSIGGMKCGPEVDHCYYSTTEHLRENIADAYLRQSTPAAPVELVSDVGNGVFVIKLMPKHPGCRFRAFETLQDSCCYHVQELANRWPAAWNAAVDGNSDKFVRELKHGRYFSGDVDVYRKSVNSLFAEFQRLPWPLNAS